MKSAGEKLTRVALVGCGAVAERLHIPVLKAMDSVSVALLVDTDQRRLELLSAGLPGVRAQETVDGIEQYADVALVALPHHLHASIGVSLLQRGLHIFVEKPLATSSTEAIALINAAKTANRVLAVGQIRRFYETSRYVKAVLEAGWLGTIKSFDVREGGEYGWPAASASLFQKEKGGGVLFDTGAHTLDCLVNWLGKASRVDYADDNRGGVEANCMLKIALESGAEGVVELSRTRNLRNTFVIEGDRGRLEVGLGPKGPVTLSAYHEEQLSLSGLPEDGERPSGEFYQVARRQLEAFLGAVAGASEAAVTGQDVAGAIEIFDQCRRNPASLQYEWEPFSSDVDWARFSGKRILVLGATGFLGYRLIEALKQHSTAEIRTLVRNYSRLSSLARHEVEIVHGDITDANSLAEALEGCEVVFNCTYGKGDRSEQYRVNVEAVKRLVEAASRAGVARVVHVSTVSVYGNVAEGVVNELRASGASRKDAYGHSKAAGEKVVLQLGRQLGLETVVIQPTVIYGPGAPVWTTGQLRLMKEARIGLVDEGRGLCNAVYIDDVVAGMLAAAVSPKVAGERFLLSGPAAVPWVEFYREYEEILGSNAVELLTDKALDDARSKIRKQGSTMSQLRRLIREEYSGRPAFIELPPLAAIRSLVRKVVPRSAIERMKVKVIAGPAESKGGEAAPVKARWLYLPPSDQEAFFRAKSVVDCTKAQDMLGYKPRYSLAEGMARVKMWAHWANLS